MNLEAKLVEKTSKSGKQYFCVELFITDTYKKIVFLENAEIELIKQLYK